MRGKRKDVVFVFVLGRFRAGRKGSLGWVGFGLLGNLPLSCNHNKNNATWYNLHIRVQSQTQQSKDSNKAYTATENWQRKRPGPTILERHSRLVVQMGEIQAWLVPEVIFHLQLQLFTLSIIYTLVHSSIVFFFLLFRSTNCVLCPGIIPSDFFSLLVEHKDGTESGIECKV